MSEVRAQKMFLGDKKARELISTSAPPAAVVVAPPPPPTAAFNAASPPSGLVASAGLVLPVSPPPPSDLRNKYYRRLSKIIEDYHAPSKNYFLISIFFLDFLCYSR